MASIWDRHAGCLVVANAYFNAVTVTVVPISNHTLKCALMSVVISLEALDSIMLTLLKDLDEPTPHATRAFMHGEALDGLCWPGPTHSPESAYIKI